MLQENELKKLLESGSSWEATNQWGIF